MDYYNDYNKFVRGQGAVMLLAAPPIMDEPSLGTTKEIWEETEQQLRHSLDFPVISKLTDYFYPKEYYYDTDYHLNDSGKMVRTEQSIKDLKSWLDSADGK